MSNQQKAINILLTAKNIGSWVMFPATLILIILGYVLGELWSAITSGFTTGNMTKEQLRDIVQKLH